MPTSPFDREVPEPRDFAALFPPCAMSQVDGTEQEHEEPSAEDLGRTNHLTAGDAALLWRELHLAYHDAVMDIALFGGAPYTPTNPDEDPYLTKKDWVVFCALPTATWSAPEEWRNKFAHGFLHLADDLAAGVEPRPRNFAEALALAIVTTRVFGRHSYYEFDESLHETFGWDEHDGIAPPQPFDLLAGLTYAPRSPLAPEADPRGITDGSAETVTAQAESVNTATPLLAAPADINDWHSPTDRPARTAPYIHRRERTDDGYADWTSLFPACPCGDYEECPRCESIQLTPRTALALRFASEILYDYAREDVGYYEDDAVDGRFTVFSRYPDITWYQDGRWRTRAAEAFHDLGDDLLEGKWPLPQTHAEEMALHLMLNDLDYITEVFEDSLDELPAHPRDYDSDYLREGLFQDEDILMLFDMPHIASPHNPLNAQFYVGDMRPNSWFKPFGQFQPRQRPEPDTSNVTPIRRP